METLAGGGGGAAGGGGGGVSGGGERLTPDLPVFRCRSGTQSRKYTICIYFVLRV